MLEGGIHAHPLPQGCSFSVYYWVLWIYQKHGRPLGGDTAVWGTRMRISCGTKVLPSLPILFLGIKVCFLSSLKQVQNYLTTNKSQDSPILSSCFVLGRIVFDYCLLPIVWFKTLCLDCKLETLSKRLASPISLSGKSIWSSQSV